MAGVLIMLADGSALRLRQLLVEWSELSDTAATVHAASGLGITLSCHCTHHTAAISSDHAILSLRGSRAFIRRLHMLCRWEYLPTWSEKPVSSPVVRRGGRLADVTVSS